MSMFLLISLNRWIKQGILIVSKLSNSLLRCFDLLYVSLLNSCLYIFDIRFYLKCTFWLRIRCDVSSLSSHILYILISLVTNLLTCYMTTASECTVWSLINSGYTSYRIEIFTWITISIDVSMISHIRDISGYILLQKWSRIIFIDYIPWVLLTARSFIYVSILLR